MPKVSSSHSAFVEVSALIQSSGVLRANALAQSGLSRQRIKSLTDSGTLVRLGRGLYSLPNSPVTENHDLAQVAARVPQCVICLISALQFHGLTTATPWRIDLMLPRGARSPQIEYPPISVVHASHAAFDSGQEQHRIEGVTVAVTSVAKTIADCFKYHHKVGLDLALEALRQVLEEQLSTQGEIRKQAKVCRVENLIRPYLEALSI